MITKTAATVAALVSTGLMSGLFFAFSVSVIPAFRKLSDVAYLTAFQAINKAILNPLFLSIFAIAPVSLAVAALLHWKDPDGRIFKLLIAATVLYGVGVFGVTAAANVPLNNKLAALPIERTSAQQLHQFRADFETPWNRWHTVRTIASISAVTLAASAAAIGMRNS